MEKAGITLLLTVGASALIKPSGRWERRNASIACRAKRSSALMASAIAMLKISLGAASGQFPPRKKFCGMDIFLRVDRRRAARFPYNVNFTVYGAFPAVFPGKGRVISRAVLNVQAGGIGAVQGIILACRKAQLLYRYGLRPQVFHLH